MTTLQIPRGIWLRGQGPNNSLLYRPTDGKMCCLGILATACGVPMALLSSQITLGAIPAQHRAKLPARLFTYLGSDVLSSPLAKALMEANDNATWSEAKREQTIGALFSELGYKVTFVN